MVYYLNTICTMPQWWGFLAKSVFFLNICSGDLHFWCLDFRALLDLVRPLEKVKFKRCSLVCQKRCGEFKSVFFLDLLLHHWFFINLYISTDWEFSFFNNAIIKFWLIYSLILPYSNQNLPFFPVDGSVSIFWKLTIRRHFTMIRK